MKKKTISLLFLILFIGLLYAYLNTVLYEKPDIGSAKNIASEKKGQIDVFFVGASHVFYGINPYEIWDRTGIASYDLATQQSPLFGSRLLLDHALKFQQPKLIVFDVIMATNFGKVLDNAEIAANMTHLVTDPIPFSFGKVKSILQTEEISEKGEMVFPIIRNHTRLQQGLLTYRDWHFPFSSHPHILKGYKYTENTLVFEKPETVLSETQALPEHLEKSFRDFIVYCQEKELPLLLIKTPMVADADLYQQCNEIARIAEEYGIPFVDFNHQYDELGIDFSTDFADKGHMNVNGARKVSQALADYLSSHYDLPDHRGDAAYAEWETGSRYYHDLAELPGINDINAYAQRLVDPGFLTVLTVSGTFEGEQKSLPEEPAAAFETLGLTEMPMRTGNGVYYAVLEDGILRTQKVRAAKELQDSELLEDVRFYIRANDDTPNGERWLSSITVEKDGCWNVKPGILILTYDKDSMRIVDRVFFDAEKDYEASREFQ